MPAVVEFCSWTHAAEKKICQTVTPLGRYVDVLGGRRRSLLNDRFRGLQGADLLQKFLDEGGLRAGEDGVLALRGDLLRLIGEELG